jgi:hypothetical protein
MGREFQLLQSGFFTIASVATEAFAIIVDGVASLGEVLVSGFRDPITAIKTILLNLAEFASEIVLKAENFLPDAVVKKVEGNLAIIKAAIAQTTPPDGTNEFSESLKGVSLVLRANNKLFEKKSAAAAKDALETTNQVDSVEKLRGSLAKMNVEVQKGLAGVRDAADRGDLFKKTAAEVKRQNEIDKENAAALAAAEKEAEDKKRLAVSSFNEFLSASEEGQLRKARDRRDQNLAGLEFELANDLSLRANATLLRLDIEEQFQQEKFDIEKKFRGKSKAEREADAKDERVKAARALNDKLTAQANLLGGIAALTESFGEENFKTVKALRIGEAIINTYAAANVAYSQFGAYGYIAAAAVVAAGLANVNTIRQQQPARAQHGIRRVQQAEQPALLHLGESVLTREETGNFNQFLTDLEENPGQTTTGGGINVTLEIENLTLMSDDDEAIGNLTTAIRRQLEEQNLVAIS